MLQIFRLNLHFKWKCIPVLYMLNTIYILFFADWTYFTLTTALWGESCHYPDLCQLNTNYIKFLIIWTYIVILLNWSKRNKFHGIHI